MKPLFDEFMEQQLCTLNVLRESSAEVEISEWEARPPDCKP
jgi:hypothetical protein